MNSYGIGSRWRGLAHAATAGCVFAACLAAARLGNAQALPSRLSGTVAAVERGDLLIVVAQGRRYRIVLDAVVAPDPDEPFGPESRAALSDLVLGRTVEVQCVGGDRLRGIRGRVSIDGRSVNKRLVSDGWAWYDERQVRSAAMEAAMEQARAAGRGLWAKPDNMPPWQRQDVAADDPDEQRIRFRVRAFLEAVHAGNVPKMKAAMSEAARDIVPNERLRPPEFLRKRVFAIADIAIDGGQADVVVELTPAKNPSREAEPESPTTPDEPSASPATPDTSTTAAADANGPSPDSTPAPTAPKIEAGQIVLKRFEDDWLITGVLLPQEESSELWAFDFEDPDADVDALGDRLRERLDKLAAASEDKPPAAPANADVAAISPSTSSPGEADMPEEPSDAPNSVEDGQKEAAASRPSTTDNAQNPMTSNSPAGEPDTSDSPPSAAPTRPAMKPDETAASDSESGDEADPMSPSPPKRPAPSVDPEQLARAEKEFRSKLEELQKEQEAYAELQKFAGGSALLKQVPDPRPKQTAMCWEVAEQYRGTPLAAEALAAICQLTDLPQPPEILPQVIQRLREDYLHDPAIVPALAYTSRYEKFDPREFLAGVAESTSEPAVRAAAQTFLAANLARRGDVAQHREELTAALNDAIAAHADLPTPLGKLGEIARETLQALTSSQPTAQTTATVDSTATETPAATPADQ